MAAFTPDQKQQAYQQLADAMFESIEKGELSEKDMQESARYIERNLEATTSYEEFILFLEDLVRHWNIYNKVYVNFKREHVEKHDEAKLSEIQNKLNSFINTSQQ